MVAYNCKVCHHFKHIGDLENIEDLVDRAEDHTEVIEDRVEDHVEVIGDRVEVIGGVIENNNKFKSVAQYNKAKMNKTHENKKIKELNNFELIIII
jgi:hypothetical protein